MAIESVREYFRQYGREQDVMEFDASSATVELAAKAVGVEEARIAKTMSFYKKEGDGCIIVVTAGDVKVDNSKFKHTFGMKAKMLKGEDVQRLTGHAPGGIFQVFSCAVMGGCVQTYRRIRRGINESV